MDSLQGFTLPRSNFVPAGKASMSSLAAFGASPGDVVEQMSDLIPVDFPACVAVRATLLVWVNSASATPANTSETAAARRA